LQRTGIEDIIQSQSDAACGIAADAT